MLIEFLDDEELAVAVQQLKVETSTGTDGVTPELVKNVPIE